MRTAITNTQRPAYYTIRETAWILGVDQARISRAIRLRTLRTELRHGRIVVPADALARLLGERTNNRTDGTTKPRSKDGQPAGHSPQAGGTP